MECIVVLLPCVQTGTIQVGRWGGGVSCTHVWWDSALWSYLVGHEGKMGKVSIRSADQARTAGGVNIPHSYNH